MWIYIIAAAVVVIGLLGAAFAGGIFTIVMLPIAAIILIGAIAYRSIGAMAEQSTPKSPSERPLPRHKPVAAPADVPTTPERLIHERQVRQ